jgi:hypothetical protein
MNEHNERQVREALKQSFPAVDTELGRDLWPDVLRKIDTQPQGVPWYDWALIALMVGLFLYSPRLIFVIAYHL